MTVAERLAMARATMACFGHAIPGCAVMANLAGDESLTDIVDIGTFWPGRDCHDYVASAILDGLSVDSVTIVEFCEAVMHRLGVQL